MKAHAIVYTSKTGFTQRYATMLARALDLPAFDLKTARSNLPKGARIIYLGWIKMMHTVGYKEAAKRFSVMAVCPVGDAPAGSADEELRSNDRIPAEVPLFSLQGGLDFQKLGRGNTLLMKLVVTAMKAQEKDKAAKRALKDMRKHGGDFVSEENLDPIVTWYKEQL